MVSRLLLGCGTVGRAVADGLADQPGDMTVLDGDEDRVRSLRGDGVPAEVADVTDPAALATRDADLVFVASDDAGQNLAAARAAREAFPEAHLVVYTIGRESDRVADVADEVVDAGTEIGGRLLDVVESEAGERSRRLRSTLRGVEGRLAVVTHDNPDPDAIGSALALVALAESQGTPADACYYGDINHQENRALVNLLDLDLVNLDPDDDLAEFGAVALVDHSRPGVNDQLPRETEVAVVVDHHPPRAPVEAEFVDLRHEVGATSTLLVEHLDRFGIEPAVEVATALLYGIRVDTDDFSREVSTSDFEAAADLLAYADFDVLRKVESPSMTADTLEIIARAIRNRRVEQRMLVSFAGEVNDRDALAQAADMLLDLEDVTVTLVFGTMDDTVYLSGRARGTDLDLGETLRDAFGQIGSAGGHADMAGAQIPLGSIVSLLAGEEEPGSVVESFVAERFYETVEDGPRSLTGGFATSLAGRAHGQGPSGRDDEVG